MIPRATVTALMTALLLSGCSQEPVADQAGVNDDFLNDMLGEPDDSPKNDVAGGTEVRTASAARDPAPPAIATAPGDRLELRLQPGDRFPLIKTVEQTLVQKSQSAPLTARTRLELVLALEVEDVQDDSIQFHVRYSRVAYSHDLAGHRMEFDSSVHQSAVPQDAIPYAGMVNNGFSFRIGRDNRIRELIGYQEFLERCVQNIPPERRRVLLTEIGQRFGDDGVANFIDDTIGLLPYNTEVDPRAATKVVVGDVWTRERRMMQPVPVHMLSTYRLTDLTSRTAEIDITGRIAAGAGIEDRTGGIAIHGGHAVGRCSVDRDTGLPLELNVTQFMTLTVTTPAGENVAQEKEVTTTIRTFPEMRGPVVQTSAGSGTVQPAAGTATSRQPVSRIPGTTPADTRVRAIPTQP